MNVSPTEAEEALAAIHKVTQKTRQSIASGGTYITLIVTGIVWMIGFMCTQFLPKEITGYIWGALSILGSVLGTYSGLSDGQARPQPIDRHDSQANWPLLAAPGLLRHCRHRHRPAHGWETSDHADRPVHHDRLSGHEPAVLFCLRLVAAADHRPGVDRLLSAARLLLSLDVPPGRRRDDRPRLVHPFEVVNHG